MPFSLTLPDFPSSLLKETPFKWLRLKTLFAFHRLTQTFIYRTKNIQKTDSLFISASTKKGMKMSKSIIGSTPKAYIIDAYKIQKSDIQIGITAHLILSATTNAAFIRHAIAEETCKAATWPTISTFVRHYKRNIYDSADAAFQRRKLQHSLDSEDDGPPRK